MIMIDTQTKRSVDMEKPTEKNSATRASGEIQAHAPGRIIVRKQGKQLSAKAEFKADCVTHCK